MREKNEMPKDELEQEPPAPETPGAAAPDAGTDAPDPLLEELAGKYLAQQNPRALLDT